MKLLLTLIATLALTGCASNCTDACLLGFGPGNPVFNAMADRADRNDPCQTKTHSQLTGTRLKSDTHVKPDFCRYAPVKGTAIIDRTGRTIGYIR